MNNLEQNIDDFSQNISSLNILVIGKTGVGKSSLINVIFGEEVAQTGSGLPVTQYFEKYTLDTNNIEEGIPINLFDSSGLELNKENIFVKGVFDFVSEQLEKGVNEQIHLAWYVINASSARVEAFECEIINKLYEQRIPVIVVLSQCDRARRNEIDNITKAIKSFDLKKVYHIIEVAAFPLEGLNQKQFGLTELVTKTSELLPKLLSDAFISRQVVDVKAKKILAYSYISASAVSCFASGFVPIPFTTTAAALTAETVLWNRIAALYGFDKLKGLGALWQKITFSPQALAALVITTIADFFVLDFIFTPAIAGGTAATFILIVGLTLTSTFEELAIEEIDGLNKEEIEKLLQEIFKKNFDKYKNIRIRTKSDITKYLN
ncbi:GTPase family protein [Chamaesiphon minutus]|uniref:Putative GTPase n=1 Tax=Chamaesiphon minutus (strain ATCC 27169 / PCC 6605) TaxID=1173020 RepID=K9UBS1_CHAP6|nr:GTPase [Chamaesiphon minutus]AFY92562.1 putative GTPase [Chamaesiphon minutus PCC 6605]